MRMSPQQAWKNFHLGEELGIAGTQIYNGLRRYYEMQTLDHTDEIFDFFYNISIGLERLLKIAVVLIEHNGDVDQDALEKSLITHNHLDLLNRIDLKKTLKLGSVHKEFLSLLVTFYKYHRYGRFTLLSVYTPDLEQKALTQFLTKHLDEDFTRSDGFFSTMNSARFREFIRKTIIKITSEIYDVIKMRASEINLYTYEIRSGSKAQTVFFGDGKISTEDVLWKELLIFFMNTKSSSGWIEFLRSIEPLDFDPELASDYLQCFQSDEAKAEVTDELTFLYEEMEGTAGERLRMMSVIGDASVRFETPDEDN